MTTQRVQQLVKQAWARRPRGMGMYYLALAGWRINSLLLDWHKENHRCL